MSPQTVYWPRPVKVEMGPEGQPEIIDSVVVDAVREEWLVEDRWWTPKPLSRRYFELVLVDGRNVVVFREPADGGRWFLQRA
jgi:hypothetical protein